MLIIILVLTNYDPELTGFSEKVNKNIASARFLVRIMEQFQWEDKNQQKRQPVVHRLPFKKNILITLYSATT
ncbi:MAG: hypothetical protein C0403_17450 [Desulfobacterium sp.]|nr:hypothetical protein [Desulfobacterium sp.]